MEKDLKEIASHFDTDAPVISVNPLGEGFINDTFVQPPTKVAATFCNVKTAPFSRMCRP